MPDTSKPGTIVWQDLTVPNAEQVRGFREAVPNPAAGRWTHPCDQRSGRPSVLAVQIGIT